MLCSSMFAVNLSCFSTQKFSIKSWTIIPSYSIILKPTYYSKVMLSIICQVLPVGFWDTVTSDQLLCRRWEILTHTMSHTHTHTHSLLVSSHPLQSIMCHTPQTTPTWLTSPWDPQEKVESLCVESLPYMQCGGHDYLQTIPPTHAHTHSHTLTYPPLTHTHTHTVSTPEAVHNISLSVREAASTRTHNSKTADVSTSLTSKLPKLQHTSGHAHSKRASGPAHSKHTNGRSNKMSRQRSQQESSLVHTPLSHTTDGLVNTPRQSLPRVKRSSGRSLVKQQPSAVDRLADQVLHAYLTPWGSWWIEIYLAHYSHQLVSVGV